MSSHRRFIATYIVCSGRNGTLYTGMSSNLPARVWKHRVGMFEGFSKTYGCTRLVWFERFGWVTQAIQREKRIMEWRRDWKLRLIEEANPAWLDLAADWFPVNDPDWAPPEED